MSTLKRALLILAVGGLMHAAGSLGHGEVGDGTAQRLEGAGVVLAIGFALLVSWYVGRIASTLGLPKLTGYLATGIAAGPHVLGYVTAPMVHGLSLVNGVAVALIALTAGIEMDVRALRPLLVPIAWITLIGVVGTALGLTGVTFALSPLLPFMEGLGLVPRLAICAVLSIVIVSGSPAIVVAIRSETGADGPVARTALGAVVIADLVVIVLFAIALSAATALVAGAFDPESAARALAWELFGSLGVGVGVGILLALYLRFVARGVELFVLTVCLVAAEVGARVHLDPLLVMLAAGMFVQNVVRSGEELHHAFEDASLPVYILFFTVAGASIDLSMLPLVAVPAIVLALVRAGGITLGSFAGARIARADPNVVRYAGVGLLPQAGLANALAILFARTFSDIGQGGAALLLGVVAINALVAPVLFRVALLKSGEAGAPEGEAQPPPDSEESEPEPGTSPQEALDA